MVEKRYNRCACGETINKNSKQCRECTGKSGPTASKPLPSDREIIKKVNKTSAPKVAAEYKVSVTTIKNILLRYPNYKDIK